MTATTRQASATVANGTKRERMSGCVTDGIVRLRTTQNRPRLLFGLDNDECPRAELNGRTRFRKPLLYPLSYGGSLTSLGVGSSSRRARSRLR